MTRFRALRRLSMPLVCFCLSSLALATASAQGLAVSRQFDHFLVNGKPKFLVFISYFDGLDASTGVMAADFDRFRDTGIGGVRVFANWWDVQGSVTDSNPLIQNNGTLNPATLTTLKTLLDIARARGLVVDLSFACETVAGLTHAQYQAGLAATAAELNNEAYRHVIFDLANERSEGDVGCPSGGFSLGQIQALRTAVKNVDPSRLVTASDVGTTGDIVTFSDAADLDFLAYHDPRGPNWHLDTDEVVVALKTAMNAANCTPASGGPCMPIYLQEPERNHYAPGTCNAQGAVYSGQTFVDAVTRAKSAGGAAWTFHTGAGFDLNGGKSVTDIGGTQGRLCGDEENFLNGFKPQLDAVAWDGDGMLDSWTNYFSATGGPGGNPDGDAANNLTEFQNGTHPRGVAAWTMYFAEGAENGFWDAIYAMVNPSGVAARTIAIFKNQDGGIASTISTVPGQRRVSIDPLFHMTGAFALEVQTDVQIATDRTMRWDRASYYSGHTERSIVGARPTWYFAEGTAAGGFSLYYLLQNPNAFGITVNATFLRDPGLPPVNRSYLVPGNGRVTLDMDADPVLSSGNLAVQLSGVGGVTFVAERAMYTSAGGLFGAGHESAGIPDLATNWFFGEGATGGFFDTYLLVANPSGSQANIQIRYLLTGGGVVTRNYAVPPTTRFTVRVDDDPAMSAAEFSSTISSTVPIAAERAMWWPDGGWYEAHSSAGAPATGNTWVVADGQLGLLPGEATYVLIANTNASPVTVTATTVFENSGPIAQHYTIPANARLTLDMAGQFPSAIGRRFGVVVTGPNGLVVERSMYWNANNVFWTGGTNSLATKIQ